MNEKQAYDLESRCNAETIFIYNQEGAATGVEAGRSSDARGKRVSSGSGGRKNSRRDREGQESPRRASGEKQGRSSGENRGKPQKGNEKRGSEGSSGGSKRSEKRGEGKRGSEGRNKGRKEREKRTVEAKSLDAGKRKNDEGSEEKASRVNDEMREEGSEFSAVGTLIDVLKEDEGEGRKLSAKRQAEVKISENPNVLNYDVNIATNDADIGNNGNDADIGTFSIKLQKVCCGRIRRGRYSAGIQIISFSL